MRDAKGAALQGVLCDFNEGSAAAATTSLRATACTLHVSLRVKSNSNVYRSGLDTTRKRNQQGGEFDPRRATLRTVEANHERGEVALACQSCTACCGVSIYKTKGSRGLTLLWCPDRIGESSKSVSAFLTKRIRLDRPDSSRSETQLYLLAPLSARPTRVLLTENDIHARRIF